MARISFIGAGNVATHMAKAFSAAGYRIGQIYAPHSDTASMLASVVGAEPIDTLSALDAESDVYIVSIKDDAVAGVLREVAECCPDSVSRLWMHTAGSVPADVFPQSFTRCGVLYPLQTFSKSIPVDMSQVPFFTEGCDSRVEDSIQHIARSVSTHVYHADSTGRRQLHIAGVLGCNIPMFLWAMAAEVLKQAGYGFDVLHPLLQATLDKAFATSPFEGMTGPARRGDTVVLQQHIADLPEEIAAIYRFMNNEILRRFGHEPIE